MKGKAAFLWIFSFIFTVAIAYYQRITGPTYPVSGKAVIGNDVIKYKLLRSFGGDGDAELKIKIPSNSIEGMIHFKRYNTNDEWTEIPMKRMGDELVGNLPHQPPAGKLMYYIFLTSGEEKVQLTEEPVLIRFKGDVPGYILIPHIIIIFIAMMMSTRTGLEAIYKGENSYAYAWWTVITLFIGGLILGPLVQKFAFGAYWTGWPFGQDLTDNKTLVAFIFWAIAVWRLKKNPANRTWPLVAMIVLLLAYLIPHSMFGSSLDYSSGQVMTGK